MVPNGDPRLPPRDDSDLALLALLAGVDDREYLGGVMYCDPGVAGRDAGPSPNKARCVGVRGISERSSSGFRSGRHAATMKSMGTTRETSRT